jgi:hypothetical protein
MPARLHMARSVVTSPASSEEPLCLQSIARIYTVVLITKYMYAALAEA